MPATADDAAVVHFLFNFPRLALRTLLGFIFIARFAAGGKTAVH